MLDYNKTNELLKLSKNGDEEAKELLIKENSPLIKSIIKRYIGKGIEFDDLYQLGSLGFLKAINNFDENFGVKFSTYAVPMIAGEIKRFIRDNGIIKVSRSVKGLNMKINKYVESYLATHENTPSIEDIAKHFGIEESEVVYAMDSANRPISLYSVIGDEGGREQYLMEKIEDEDSLDKKMNNELLYSLIKELPPREKKIIILRYFRDKTQKEIANVLGVSQVQVSRLENKILDKLKDVLVWKNIRKYAYDI